MTSEQRSQRQHMADVCRRFIRLYKSPLPLDVAVEAMNMGIDVEALESECLADQYEHMAHIIGEPE